MAGLAGSYSLTWGTSNANYSAQPVQQANSHCITPPNVTGSQPVVVAITLPNGQSYQFQYDPTYGLVNKISYPSGAYVRYVWGLNATSDAGTWPTTDPNGDPSACYFQYGTPAVQHRYVSFDGSTEVLRQDFTYSTSWATIIPSIAWVSKQTTLTTADLVRGTSFETDYTYVPASCGGPAPPNVDSYFADQCPVEQTVVYKDWDGSVLRTESKTWIDANMLSSDQVTLNNGQTAKTTYAYANNNTTALMHEKDEYDYGQGSPGPLLRKTITNYASFPATPLLSDGPYIFDRPCQIITYDGGNARVAEQDFLYDGQAALCGSPGSALTAGVSNLSGHDDTNYAAGSTTPRGNATSIIEQCILLSTHQPCPQRASLSTSYSYDETGQVISMTDAAGNPPTTYSYANSFTDTTPAVNTNAFLTEIDYPTTGGISHKEKFSYAYSDGQLTQSVDQNNQVTGYAYNDALRRLTETDYPSSFGKSVTTYTDTPLAVSVERTRQIDATHSTDVIVHYDGAGQEISRTTANGESTPWDRVDTCYDGSGRIKFSSYPYQIASSTTAPNCAGNGDSLVYDALGRIKSITHSDGSAVSTTYTGRATDVKDEGNGTRLVERISQVDGLGLLRYVCEITGQSQQGISPSPCTPPSTTLDISGTGFLTSYSYSALGDLQTVSQGALSRSFQYDSLSRLTQSNNPESGAVDYSYDSDSNCTAQTSYPGELISKLDARNVRTCFSYDPLHRLTGKAYITSGTTASSTPSVTYNYDEASRYGRNLALTVGRKSSETTASPNPTGEVFSYDAMGHVIDNSQCTPQNCGNNTAFAVTNPSYDDLGDVLSATNGAGVTLGYTYNVAGRLYSVTSSWNDANHPGTLLNSAHYNAFGSPTSLSIGNLPLTDTRVYSTQRPGWGGWVSSINVGGPSTQSTGNVTISGAEKTQLQSNGTYSTGSVTINGSERTTTVWVVCGPNGTTCPHTEYDGGTVTVTVNGVSQTVQYGSTSTAASVASSFTTAFGSSVTASISGTTMTFTSNTPGSSGNSYGLSTSCLSQNSHFTGCSFSGTPSGSTLTGGSDPAYTYDSGTVKLFANNIESDASYGQGSTSTSIAAQLASAVNGNNPNVSATSSGNVVTLTSRNGGAYTNYSLSATSSGSFNPVSFTTSASGPNMSGGTGAILYALGMSYFNNGDIQTANDSVNGNWSYSYDDFNRLNTAVASNINTGCIESYDRYGNRWGQQPYGGAGYGCGSFTASFGGNNNRIDLGEGYGYDASGNVTSTPDGLSYAYDAENRIVAINGGSVASYAYNAEGQRVRKVTASGTVDFLYDLAAHVTSEVAVGPVTSIDIRFTNDSCSGCGGGTPVGGGDRNLFVNSISLGTTTIFPTDPSISYTSAPCNSTQGNVAYILCNGDIISTNPPGGSVESITVNAYGSPDYYVYPHMQIFVNGLLMGEWDVTDSAESYTVSAKWNRGELYAGAMHIATYANGTTYFTHYDWLGAERVRSTLNGGIYSQWTDLPFGEGSNAPNPSPTHFTGKERDAESGLDNFGTRHYGSAMGRFMQPDEPFADQDPANPQSWSLYSYVMNNPLRYNDPSGMAHTDSDGFWVGDRDGECETQNGGAVCWNAKAKEWQAPPPPPPDAEEHSMWFYMFHTNTSGTDRNSGAKCDTACFNAWSQFHDMTSMLGGLYAATAVVYPGDTVVIGKLADLKDLGPGERTLDLPNQGSIRANAAQNSSRLREAMNQGRPIRDASAGKEDSNTGFLRFERNILQNHGWTLKGDYWYPPNGE
ncbi:MAG TPA: RHS repeat-associated core domain-containing protein [Terriglobales bacterium]|nr:RHS repeat-associated core domain-containing protein [Terriglobales bacterium]